LINLEKQETIKYLKEYGCDEEALRIATDYLLYWSPGILNTKPIDIEYILPITFQIAK
jgi:hypothetical protein